MRPLLVGMLMFAACTAAIPPLDGAFASSTSGDCVAGFVSFTRVCTPEGAVPPEMPDAGQPLDADYLQVISRAEALGYERPSLAQQRVHARFVGELKDAGVWSRLDALYVMMASIDDGRISTLNWKDPARFQLVPMGAPLWTRWDATHKIGGWTAPDAGSYLDTALPSNERAGIERDVGYAIALDTPVQTPGNRAAYGTSVTGGWTLLRPGGGANVDSYIDGASFGFSNPSDLGFYVNTRRELDVMLPPARDLHQADFSPERWARSLELRGDLVPELGQHRSLLPGGACLWARHGPPRVRTRRCVHRFSADIQRRRDGSAGRSSHSTCHRRARVTVAWGYGPAGATAVASSVWRSTTLATVK